MNEEATPTIVETLLKRGNDLLARPFEPLRFTDIPEANVLLNDLEGHPHAFVLACVMDRQITAERAWKIPYIIMQRIGSFEFPALRKADPRVIRAAFFEPEAIHRFPEVIADNFLAGVDRIDRSYAGDASKLWTGRPTSAAVVRRFLEFQGVGPKIATMAANILVRDFKISVGDKISIDVSADVQVRRVFGRLGLIRKDASTEEVIYRAREFNPSYPGVFDLSAWEIGRNWCRPSAPLCCDCYMHEWCPSSTAPPVPTKSA